MADQMPLIPLTDQERKTLHEELSAALTDFLKTEEDKATFNASFNERLAALWKTIQRVESQLRDQPDREQAKKDLANDG